MRTQLHLLWSLLKQEWNQTVHPRVFREKISRKLPAHECQFPSSLITNLAFQILRGSFPSCTPQHSSWLNTKNYPPEKEETISKRNWNFWPNNCLQGRVPHGWCCLKRKVLGISKRLTCLQRHLMSMTTSGGIYCCVMKRLRSSDIHAIVTHILLKGTISF